MGLVDDLFGWGDSEEDYREDLDSRHKSSDDDLKETHSSLDSDEPGFSSCGDSNCAEK